MKEKDLNDREQGRQKGQRPHDQKGQDKASASAKGMNREGGDELLTTGGPVDRSAIDESDHGVVYADTGMNMSNEEMNLSKDDFPRMSSSTVLHDYELDEKERDFSQDKTEGIVNPRTTVSEWAEWKNSLKGEEDSNKGESNTDRDAEEFKDIAPV